MTTTEHQALVALRSGRVSLGRAKDGRWFTAVNSNDPEWGVVTTCSALYDTPLDALAAASDARNRSLGLTSDPVLHALEATENATYQETMAHLAGAEENETKVNVAKLRQLLLDALPGAKWASCKHNRTPDADATWHCCNWAQWVDEVEAVLT